MLIEMCSNSSPLCTISMPVASTTAAAGKNCGLKKLVAMTCHTTIIPTIDAM